MTCAMTSQETNVRPEFAIPEDNKNIYCDEDENLWPNPQDEIHENKEVQWGTFQFTFYCTVLLQYLFAVVVI